MKCNLSNRKSEQQTPREEEEYRQRIANRMAKIMKIILNLLRPLIVDVPDYRDQRYVRYTKENLFLYGIMMFSMQMSSRRDANRQMTHPIIQENFSNILPGLNAVPHADTLAKFLKSIGDTEIIQKVYGRLIKKLLRNKEFKRMIRKDIYTVLIDGSGKTSKDWKFDEKAVYRKHANGTTYFCYVLEAVLVLANGMVLPLCTEFLRNETGEEFVKKDCELKAW
jgi:hypothetical protein